MKKQYFDLMEQVLSAYTDEHIVRYFEDVKNNGLREHGFARLTSNIGILIAHGRRRDLLPTSCLDATYGAESFRLFSFEVR